MPHIRIDVQESHRSELPQIADALHRSLVAGLGMDEDDLFQKFNLHGPGELLFSPTFPAADRDEIIYIEVLAGHGYTKDEKDSMYQHMVDNFEAIGIRRDTLLISMIEINGSENWHSPSAP